MLKHFLLHIVIFTFPVLLQAQPTGYTPVSDKAAFVDAYRKTCTATQSYRAVFEQSKSLAILKKALQSQGIITMRNDQKMRIEYTAPQAYICIMNGEKIVIKDGDRPATSMSVRSNKLLSRINTVSMAGINGQLFDNKNMRANVYENNDYYLVEVLPLSKDLKEFYHAFFLYFNKKNYRTEKMVMEETSGDNTVMLFKQIQINTPIDDKLFEIH